MRRFVVRMRSILPEGPLRASNAKRSREEFREAEGSIPARA